MILCDAGPLVALLHQGDQHHQACRETFRQLYRPEGLGRFDILPGG